MNEFGSSFTENIFGQILTVIDQKIKEKNHQIFNYYKKKLKEAFILFKKDKKELEKLIENKEKQVIFFYFFKKYIY